MIEKIMLAISLLFTGGTPINNKEPINNQNYEVQSSEKGVTNKIKSTSNIILKTHWKEDYSANGYESFNSVIETKNGGFVCVGESTVLDNVSLGDAVIVKYSKDGSILWETNLLGDDTDYYTNVAEDDNGNLYAIGKTFSSNVGFINKNNDPNAIIVKYTSSGAQDWIIDYNDGGRQINFDDIVVSGNNLFIVGNKMYNGSRTSFIQICNKDDGLIQKLVHLEDINFNTNIKSIIKLADDSFLLLGNSIKKDSLKEYPLAIKVKSDGSKMWSYDLSINSNINKEGGFNSAVELSDSTILLGGYTQDDTRKSSLIVKLNKDGSVLWEKEEYKNYSEECKFVSVNKYNEIITTCEKTPLGNIYLSSDLEIPLKRYDLDGNLLESYLLNNSKNIEHVKSILTSDNKIVVVGKSYNTELDISKCNTRSVIDECLDSNSYIAVVEMFDTCTINQLPEISILDEVVKINKGDYYNVMDGVSATDEGKNITDQVVATPDTIDTSIKGTHTITYTVSDSCGETTETRIINVIDPCDTNNLPVINIKEKVVTINKGDSYNVMTGVTATDEGRDVTGQVIATPDTINTSVKGNHTITYRVSDVCGETVETRTIKVIDTCDTNNLPVININEKVVTINKGETYDVMTGITATDEGKNIIDQVVATPDTIDTSVKGNHTITYRVSDECGETVETRTINVIDPCDTNNLPIINIDKKVVTINKGEPYNVMDGVSATDEGFIITSAVVATPDAIDTSVKGTHTITYTVNDNCGKTIETRTINVIDPCDTNNLPVINIDEKVVTINKGGTYDVMTGVTATDEGKNIIDQVVATPDTIDTSSKGVYTITYEVSDECGKTTETRRINVIDSCDTNDLPVISINEKVVTINKGELYSVMNGVTATDEGKDITDQVVATPDVINTSVKGTHTITYTVSDECGETTETRTINIIDPCDTNNLPVININEKVVTINKGDMYNVMTGVTATDEGNNVTDQIVATPDTIDTSIKGNHTITYTVSDACGETTETRTINVIDPCDTNNLPVININEKVITINKGETYNVMDGVSATDEGKDITDQVVATPNVIDTSVKGTHTITYTVNDECGETIETRTINIIDPCDINGEAIIYVNSEYVVLESGEEFNLMEGVRAEYNGQDITNSISVTPDVIDTSKEGLIEVVYNVITECGEVTKKIKVVVSKNPCEINEAPVIDTSNLVLNIELGKEFNPLNGVIATDKENGDITDRITIVKNNVDTNQKGEYEVIYSVIDDCGVAVEKAVIINVVLNPCATNIIPEIIVSDKEILLGKKFNPLDGVVAKDGDVDITESIKIKENTVDENKIGEYTVTYIVSDECEAVEKTIKVNVKEIPEVKGEEDEIVEDNNVTVVKPQTGDSTILPYIVLSIMSTVSIVLLHKKK